jgi:hypothetical protein
MKTAMKLLPLGLLLVVAACNHTQPLGKDFGNSVHHNMSMHIINPAPDLEGREVPDMEGTTASGAVERYESGAVIAPEVIETTD